MEHKQSKRHSPVRNYLDSEMILGGKSPSRLAAFTESRKSSEYILNPPDCPYHHLPVTHLCVSASCPCPNYTICTHQNCVDIHKKPILDMIELTTFNNLVIKEVSSLLAVTERTQIYFNEVKAAVLHEMEKDIATTISFLQNSHVPHVLSLIKSNQLKMIQSKDLGHFLQGQISQEQRRTGMEKIRDSIARKIDQTNERLKGLYNSQQYEVLMLKDIAKMKSLSSRNSSSTNKKNDSCLSVDSRIMELPAQQRAMEQILTRNSISTKSQWRLIHRGSVNNFSASAYRKDVEGIRPTITIIQTTKGNKFGAYLNCPIYREEGWICDSSGQSFIFSLDKNQTYRLKRDLSKLAKAAYGGTQGPQIGSGCDIYVLDKCDMHDKNGANLGGSYELPQGLIFNSVQAREYLAGEQYYRVAELEVFSLG